MFTHDAHYTRTQTIIIVDDVLLFVDVLLKEGESLNPPQYGPVTLRLMGVRTCVRKWSQQNACTCMCVHVHASTCCAYVREEEAPIPHSL